jgi:hypothetical protein
LAAPFRKLGRSIWQFLVAAWQFSSRRLAVPFGSWKLCFRMSQIQFGSSLPQVGNSIWQFLCAGWQFLFRRSASPFGNPIWQFPSAGWQLHLVVSVRLLVVLFSQVDSSIRQFPSAGWRFNLAILSQVANSLFAGPQFHWAIPFGKLEIPSILVRKLADLFGSSSGSLAVQFGSSVRRLAVSLSRVGN